MAKNDIISIPVSKTEMEQLLDGSTCEVVRPLKDTLCKKIRGLGIICHYSMPSNEVNTRICQKTGEKCVSGLMINKYNVKFYCSSTKESKVFAIYNYRLDDDMNLHIKVIISDNDEKGD